MLAALSGINIVEESITCCEHCPTGNIVILFICLVSVKRDVNTQICQLLTQWKNFAPRHRVPKPAWYKASDSDISSYKNCLLQNLSDLDMPFTALLCRNVMCSDPSHTAALQSLASSIAAACVTAALSCIPQTNNRQESMRRTKAQYLRAIRLVRKNERDNINEKFAETITERRDRDLWAEVQGVGRTHPNAV